MKTRSSARRTPRRTPAAGRDGRRPTRVELRLRVDERARPARAPGGALRRARSPASTRAVECATRPRGRGPADAPQPHRRSPMLGARQGDELARRARAGRRRRARRSRALAATGGATSVRRRARRRDAAAAPARGAARRRRGARAPSAGARRPRRAAARRGRVAGHRDRARAAARAPPSPTSTTRRRAARRGARAARRGARGRARGPRAPRGRVAGARRGRGARSSTAHALLLDDAAILEPGARRIAGGRARRRARGTRPPREAAAAFRALDDPYLRERAVDVEDVARRVLAQLAGTHARRRRSRGRASSSPTS